MSVYTLENLVTNKLKDFHVKLLTQYNHDELNSDIIISAELCVSSKYEVVGCLSRCIVCSLLLLVIIIT